MSYSCIQNTFFYDLEALIEIKEETKLNLERCKKSLPIHMKSKSKYQIRDKQLRDAMRDIDPKRTKHPWSVKRFLNEIAVPESDKLFEVMDLGKQIL